MANIEADSVMVRDLDGSTTFETLRTAFAEQQDKTRVRVLSSTIQVIETVKKV